MLEQLKYKNHQNEVFEFGKEGIYVDTSALHDYEWAVTEKGRKISALTYKVSKRKLPVIIICQTEEDGIKARNRLMEVTEKDVLAMQHGQIIIGNYYFRCFVTRSQKKDYLRTKRYMRITLTLVSDFPFWIKETTTKFRKITETESTEGNLDYNVDYPYDYYNSTESKKLSNTGFADSNFRMTIYGKASNPAVYVAGHLYQVDCEVAENEYLTIDSIKKQIILTGNDGTKINAFNLRNRDSYIFEKIPPGQNVVMWEGDFAVDITLLEERSEPEWT